jgi:hypothetical protein
MTVPVRQNVPIFSTAGGRNGDNSALSVAPAANNTGDTAKQSVNFRMKSISV